MIDSREISLQPGQCTDVLTSASDAGYLMCLKGTAHLITARMGIGWTMQAGEGCMLRTPMRYRVRARTAVRLILQARVQFFKPSKTD